MVLLSRPFQITQMPESPELKMRQERGSDLVLASFLCCSSTIACPSALLSVKQMCENRGKKPVPLVRW